MDPSARSLRPHLDTRENPRRVIQSLRNHDMITREAAYEWLEKITDVSVVRR